MGVMRFVCAWCTRVLREGDPGEPTSHGICEDCRKRVHEQLDKWSRQV